MSLLKYIDRLKRMDDLIRRKATGSAEDFAEKLGISKTQLYEDLKEFRGLGAPVVFCQVRKSYCYEGDFRLILKFEENLKIKGGNFFHTPVLLEWHHLPYIPQVLLNACRGYRKANE